MRHDSLVGLLRYKLAGTDFRGVSCMVNSFSWSRGNGVELICGSSPLVIEIPGWGYWFSDQWLADWDFKLVIRYTNNIIWDFEHELNSLHAI